MDASIYGTRPPKRKSTKEISSSTTVAFTSQLSSLISSSSNNDNSSSSGRARPSKSRSDIFTSHNKGVKKRAAADLENLNRDNGKRSRKGKGGEEEVDDISLRQVHHRTDEIGGAVDAATLHRSKRKMEEKARLYAAMKRGDYVPPSSSSSTTAGGWTGRGGGGGGRDEREHALVDFDRKWVEREQQKRARKGGKEGEDYYSDESEDEDDDDDDDGDEGEEPVEYEDEFGRLRTGTRAQAAREERRRLGQAQAAREADENRARPTKPDQLIFGDTIQSAAFNPDSETTVAMETLVQKRDRSATPPEETHYDAGKEVRSKGVGFFQFSRDEGMRKGEMERLERERAETEKRRAEAEAWKRRRKEELEERKRKIGEKRAGKLAEGFLEGLSRELESKADER